MKRAYSLFEIKAFDDDKRELEGMATTPTADRLGDIVEPEGAEFKLPLPLLWQHMSSQPIGHVIAAKVTAEGIRIKARLAKLEEPGALKNRLDEAWQSLKLGLVRGLSIGFNPLEYSQIKDTFSYRFTSWEWLELSAVTIPANSEATIQTVKSIDAELLAALGRGQERDERRRKSAGASAPKVNLHAPEGKGMNIAEQIKAWEAKRAATVAVIEALMAKSVDSGESLDEEDDEKYQEASAEVKSIDKQLARLKEFEKLQAEKAAPVETKQVGPVVMVKKFKDKEEDFPGQNFTRRVIARTLAYMSQGELRAIDIAEQRWGKTNPTLIAVMKAAVPGGGTDTGEWGAELAEADSRYTGDFIEFLYGKTVYNQLNLRPIPDNVTIKGQDGGSTGYWVGESKAIPVTTADFFDVTLRSLKVAAIAVISKELIRRSSPSAEMLVRDSLANAAAQRIDATFLSTAAAVSGVSPAGILNGLSDLGSNGSDADAVRADIAELYAPFIAAKNASNLTFVMGTALAKAVSLMRNPLGQVEFVGLNVAGGTLEGDRVVTGDNVPAGHVILLKESDIYKIGDTGIEVSVSDQATIEQDSAPQGASDTPVAASATLSSMFQTESVALKIVQPLNYAKRRASAVAYIGDAGWGNATSTTA